jgi:membrane protein DedA with SNARE-associated domain
VPLLAPIAVDARRSPGRAQTVLRPAGHGYGTLLPVSTHTINHLIHDYGCALVFAVVGLQALGAPLPGTTALIAASLYAATSHGLPIEGVIAAAAGGALLGTCGGFALGRWGGEPLAERLGRRFKRSPERVAQLRAEVARHGGPWLIIARWITGVRNVAGLVAGASGMAVSRFLRYSTIAAVAWALVTGLEYYFFGRAVENADTWVQIVIIVVGLAWTVVSFRVLRRRALRRLRTVSESTAT